MASRRRAVRGVLLCEDRRTERFLRHLLVHLGFEKRQFRFRTAPSGVGAASAWVRKQYPGEVRILRSKSYQDLSLVAAVDGDNMGVRARKQSFDKALVAAGLAERADEEQIALPVPTWCIETWLLDLLGYEAVTEDRHLPGEDERTYKAEYESLYGRDEKTALVEAARSWRRDGEVVASLEDGRAEVGRLSP